MIPKKIHTLIREEIKADSIIPLKKRKEKKRKEKKRKEKKRKEKKRKEKERKLGESIENNCILAL
ncbi:hypothetical protein [Methanosarcina barkeri]|uniref:hypothetical protein n=1 Tax=Methanosarcina barkeri TaxID=2208 RepID=UPI0006D22E89|nr:hypothetical protein [Methanosarcina barkeri]